ISFRLRGIKSNRDAIGAAVTLEASALRQTKYLQAGSGFLSQHTKEISFGLGTNQGFVRATVQWPSGLRETYEDLPVNRAIEIEEGMKAFTAKAFATSPHSWNRPGDPPKDEVASASVGTWLIDPVKAIDFSLPD